MCVWMRIDVVSGGIDRGEGRVLKFVAIWQRDSVDGKSVYGKPRPPMIQVSLTLAQ